MHTNYSGPPEHQFRCSIIFPTLLPVDPPSVRLQSDDRSHLKDRPQWCDYKSVSSHKDITPTVIFLTFDQWRRQWFLPQIHLMNDAFFTPVASSGRIEERRQDLELPLWIPMATASSHRRTHLKFGEQDGRQQKGGGP
ncbi:hypothetical protein ACLOJK_028282 [Asimina triloba]